ncbi:MAG: SDR family oxidoreductase [Anaerolineae bacterium]
MDLNIQGKVALVVAASKGLGKAAALALVKEGVNVCIAARELATLNQAADELKGLSPAKVLAVPADVTVQHDLERLASTVRQELGPVDILVNNAGGPRPGLFAEMSDDDWQRAFNLNFMSAARLTRMVLPGMRERRWGRIINITSISVKQPLPNLILSNAVRTALVSMAKTLAGQVAEFGITVNNVCPGYTLTDRVRAIAVNTATQNGTTSDQVIAEMEASIPMRRLGKPEELGALITFLASEQAAYITGTTIQCDGGYYAGLM